MTEVYKSSGACGFGGSVGRGGVIGGSIRPVNRYLAECHAPVAVSDMGELAFEIGPFVGGIPQFALADHVSHKWVEQTLRPALARMGKIKARIVERLLSGGGLRWSDQFCNLVVNTGLDNILTQYWKGSAYTAAHYVGLTAGSPTPAAGHTMALHTGWTEVTDYDEPNRQTLTLGAVSGQSVDNSASKATFTANASVTVGGAFITTDNTRGGTGGTLITVGALTGGNRSLLAADTLSVTATLTLADDGV